MSGPLLDLLLERIHRHGPLPFDAFVEAALYHPEHGFYSAVGGAGRRGDFVTSPEVGALFGAVVARALDAWWEQMRRPDPFVVVEAGAGRGALARSVLDAAPRCARALRYVCVERSAALRHRQEELLSLEPAVNALGPVADGEDDEGPWPLAGSGPIVTALDDLPAATVDGVVLANELLDNMPFRLLERAAEPSGGWREIRVGMAPDGASLAEVAVEAPPSLAAEAERLAPASPPGARIPVQQAATAWLRHALATVRRGRVVVIDYASSTRELADRPWLEWVRSYRRHGRGGHPLEAVGEQDVTCEVACDQLTRVQRPVADRSQAEFLAAHGIEELVDEARAAWRGRAHVGDLAAVRARSRVTEADALLDAAGLGAFRVIEWELT